MDIPESGAVFTLGKSSISPSASEDHQSYFFIKNDAVKKLVAGKSQSAVICESGRLFVWGKNQFGQLGISSSTTIARPSCVKEFKSVGLKIKDVTFGDGFSAVVTDDDRVFFCGRKISYIEKVEFDSKPMEIEDFGKFAKLEYFTYRQIKAGDSHILVLTDIGTVYGWGSNQSNQLNSTDSDNLIETPTQVEIFERVLQIECGKEFSVFLTENNKVILKGEIKSKNIHQEIKFEQKIFDVHVSHKDEIYLIGENDILLANDDLNFVTVNIYENEKIYRITTGDNFKAFLTESEKFITNFDHKHYHEIPKFTTMKVVDISAGLNHVLVHAIPIPMETITEETPSLATSPTPQSDKIPELKSFHLHQRNADDEITSVVKQIIEDERQIYQIDEAPTPPKSEPATPTPPVAVVTVDKNDLKYELITNTTNNDSSSKETDSDMSLPTSGSTVKFRPLENETDVENYKKLDRAIELVRIKEIAAKTLSPQSQTSDKEEKITIVDLTKGETYSVSSLDGHVKKIELRTSSAEGGESLTSNEIRYIDNGIDVTDDVAKIEETKKKKKSSTSSILRSGKVAPTAPFYFEDQFLGEKMTIFQMKEIRDSKTETQRQLREAFKDVTSPVKEPVVVKRVKTPLPIKSRHFGSSANNPFDLDSDEDRRTTASLGSERNDNNTGEHSKNSDSVAHKISTKIENTIRNEIDALEKEEGKVKKFFREIKESSCANLATIKTTECYQNCNCANFKRKIHWTESSAAETQAATMTTTHGDGKQTSAVCNIL